MLMQFRVVPAMAVLALRVRAQGHRAQCIACVENTYTRLGCLPPLACNSLQHRGLADAASILLRRIRRVAAGCSSNLPLRA
jgi:hypothetical protein